MSGLDPRKFGATRFQVALVTAAYLATLGLAAWGGYLVAVVALAVSR
jgi:hypothetical protein